MAIDPTAAWKSLAAEFLAESNDEESPPVLDVETSYHARHASNVATRPGSELSHSAQPRSPPSILSSRRAAPLLAPTAPTKPKSSLLEQFSTNPKLTALMRQAREGRAFLETDNDLVKLAKELDVMPQELSVELIKYKSDVYLESIKTLLKSAASQDVERTLGHRAGSAHATSVGVAHRYDLPVSRVTETKQATSDDVEIIDQEETMRNGVAHVSESLSPLSRASATESLQMGPNTKRTSGRGRRQATGNGAIVPEEGPRLRRSTRLRNAPKRFTYREFGDDSDSQSPDDDYGESDDDWDGQGDVDGRGIGRTSLKRNRNKSAPPRKRGRNRSDSDSDVEVIDLISSDTPPRLATRHSASYRPSSDGPTTTEPPRPVGATSTQSPEDKMVQFRMLRDQQRKRFELAMQGKLAPSQAPTFGLSPSPGNVHDRPPQTAAATSSVSASSLPSTPPVLVQFQHSISGLPDVIFLTSFESPMSNVLENYNAKMKELVPQDSLPNLSKSVFRYEGEILSLEGIFGMSGIDTELDMVGSRDFQGSTYPLYIIDVSFPKK